MRDICRILHVVTYMGRGGLETMLMNYYRQIDRNKIQFDFLTHRSFKADYDDEILLLGGRIFHLPRLNPFSSEYKSKLRSFFKEHSEYSIIHVHQDCMSSVILKIAKECGVKVRIAHSHSNFQDLNIKLFVKLFYKHKIGCYATHLMACSRNAGEWMFGKKPFQVLRNAIEASRYNYNTIVRKNIREKLKIGNDTLVVGHVGRFSPPKNHSFIIDIFNALHIKNSNSVLLLVGDGEGRSLIEKKIKQLKLQEHVLLLGKRSDVNEIMQAMDVFLFPSIYEGLGIVVIEAQASGMPCLISDKVPTECKITNLVYRLRLKDDISTWVENILKLSHLPRENTYETIIKNGYDIKQNVEFLQDFYLCLH